MLTFSRKTDYALVAIAELAVHSGRCMSSSRLAEAIDAPEAVLRNVLKSLAKAELLTAERGPFGGYALNREPSSVSVLEVIEAIEGPVVLARCCSDDETPEEHGCVHTPRCRIQHAMRMIHGGVVSVLGGVTVADLAVARPGEPRTESHDATRVPLRLHHAPSEFNGIGEQPAHDNAGLRIGNGTSIENTQPATEQHLDRRNTPANASGATQQRNAHQQPGRSDQAANEQHLEQGDA